MVIVSNYFMAPFQYNNSGAVRVMVMLTSGVAGGEERDHRPSLRGVGTRSLQEVPMVVV